MTPLSYCKRVARARFLALFIAALFATCLDQPLATAAERIALVIGNSQYVHTDRIPQLPNPTNDAADIATALKRIGFTVIAGIDLDRREMEARIREFSDKLASARIALFFYAGHGLQVDGKNYLVPTDAQVKNVAQLDLDAIDLQIVLKQMEGFERTNLVFLDACRDNPLASQLARSLGKTRSANIRQGLANVKSGAGTFIAFATEPGNVALDGNERNSPFTAALLKHIETPGLDIALVMRRVTAQVKQATGDSQTPWSHSSLVSDVVLVPAALTQTGGPFIQPPRIPPVIAPAVHTSPSSPQPKPLPAPDLPLISTRLDLAAECDELTAFRSDPDLPPGNKWQNDYSNIDVTTALRICQRAVDDARDTRVSRRMILQLGRAVAAQGRAEAMDGNQAAARRSFERAVELWKRAASMNSGQAFNVLGSYVQGSFNMSTPRGPFVTATPDYKAAFQHYQRAADLGNPNGLTNAGIALIGLDERFGIPVDYRKARLYLEQARKLELSSAYYGIGRSKMLGMGYEKNEAEGLRYVSVAFCKGHGQAKALFERGTYQRPNCAEQQFANTTANAGPSQQAPRLSSDAGELCDKLAANPTDRRKPVTIEGIVYGSLREHSDQAISACETAVRQSPGERRYQYQLGRALQFKDRGRAFDIHRRLVLDGYAAAHDNLGWLYLSEQNNPIEAVRQFAIGTSLEDPDSMVSLAEMISRGYFNPPDPGGAKLMLFKRAAELGHPNATRAYELEIGLVEQSRQRAANQKEMQRQMVQFFGTILGNFAWR